MAVTDRRASTTGPSVAPRPDGGKSWVLAMLTPKRGLRVAPVPPQARRICHHPFATPKQCQVGTDCYSNEAHHSRTEASKDRPCVIVLAVRRETDNRMRVGVVPITHTYPARAALLPPNLKRHLGLDDDASWIVLDEANEFVWPGVDLRPIARTKPRGLGLRRATLRTRLRTAAATAIRPYRSQRLLRAPTSPRHALAPTTPSFAVRGDPAPPLSMSRKACDMGSG